MKQIVAIVGRPNVGKSTLMNRILGRREAIVEERPGVTRDRKEVEASWQGREFTLVDTGGWIAAGDSLDEKVSRQSERAMSEADVVLFVVDSTVGVTEDDARVAALLRGTDTPVIVGDLVGQSHEPLAYLGTGGGDGGHAVGQPTGCGAVVVEALGEHEVLEPDG